MMSFLNMNKLDLLLYILYSMVKFKFSFHFQNRKSLMSVSFTQNNEEMLTLFFSFQSQSFFVFARLSEQTFFSAK